MLRGTAQNPDVFFQAREACNPFYDAAPGIVQETMDRFAKLIGPAVSPVRLRRRAGRRPGDRGDGLRRRRAEETVEKLTAEGEKVGVVKVRLFRPFDVKAFLAACPRRSRRIAVLDRTKEPGGARRAAVSGRGDGPGRELGSGRATPMPRVIGGRYGLSSKEFTPGDGQGRLRRAEAKAEPKKHFTVGIIDDVTQPEPEVRSRRSRTEADDVTRAVFYGLGSDGTVGANKNSVKIIGENTPLYAQGYFVYDSKKAGSVTVSHLRFSPRPIKGTYLIEQANFVACHQFVFLEKLDVLALAGGGRDVPAEQPLRPGRGLGPPAAGDAGDRSSTRS